MHEVEAEIGVPVELMLLRGQASAWDSHKPTGLRLRGAGPRDAAEVGDAGGNGREAEVGHFVAEEPGGAGRAGPALVSRAVEDEEAVLKCGTSRRRRRIHRLETSDTAPLRRG